MYDLPYNSCVHSDHRGSGVGYGYTGEESKIDHHEDHGGSIQFSIQSNEQLQQEQPQLSDIEMIRRRALLLKQKFHMIGRYDDLLDMDSLYSESVGGEDHAALNEDNNATTLMGSIGIDQYHPEPVTHNTQHSFGSLYSASSSSQSDEEIAEKVNLSKHELSNGSTRSSVDGEAIRASPKQSIRKFQSDASFGTDPEKSLGDRKEAEPTNEYRFKVKKATTIQPAIFCPREEEADVDSLYSLSHGEIEDILEGLENEAENGLVLAEKLKDKRSKEGVVRKDILNLVTTTPRYQPREQDSISIQSFATDESDDEYGFDDLACVTHDESCRHEMQPKSTAKCLASDLKRSIDTSQKPAEHPTPLGTKPDENAWSSQRVELFLNEYKNLHQRKQSEVAALESRMQEYVVREAEMKREANAGLQQSKKEQLELAKTKESLNEAKKCLALKELDCDYLMRENTKLKQKNTDLIVSIQECKSDAAANDRRMKRDYQDLKETHVKMSQTLEYRLTRFQCLVQDLQDHSRKLEQGQGIKLEEMNEKLGKQKTITNRYKKKYLTVCEKRDTMNDDLKSQRERIEALEKRLQNQKTSTATKIADLKKKLRKKKKSKKGVKKTDAVCC
ncbi:unnamed protein product [Cylindrotheca closterium]|uniref:Uncharacterized protein n=1 Tax=Cylindrotheca closterium TaxID=2856 RepID=A0AAD2FR30_9STRA|nr:unnamed protein product [Cylindrotheca closterium]